MRAELEPAVILHRRAYSESSLLVEALARAHGRVGLIARGARRGKAQWRGLLEPLAPLRLSWRGGGELHTLTGAEPGTWRPPGSGDNLYAGLYAGELTMRLTARDDPHPVLFDSLVQLLRTLAGGDEPALPVMCFERDLLAASGYALPLTQESATGEAVAADRDYLYHPEHGLRRADGPPARDEAPATGATLLALAAGEVTGPEQTRAARRLLKTALAPHLGGRPLRTVQTMRAMRQLAREGQQTQ